MEDYKYLQFLLTRCNGFCCHMVANLYEETREREEGYGGKNGEGSG